MIGRLSGTLLLRTPPHILLDVQGVGYEVDVPMSTFYELPALGAAVVLLIHQVVREDAILLFGFMTEAERTVFRQLLKISGVGPRLALAVLSGLSIAELGQAVASADTARLTRIPGVGKKTAERLLLELREKVTPLVGATHPTGSQAQHLQQRELQHALMALGYNDREISWVGKQLSAELGLEESIRHALKLLSRKE